MSDSDTIYESDVRDPWVECEYGAEYCTGGAEVVWMYRDATGWLCETCWNTVQAEFEDYMHCARYAR